MLGEQEAGGIGVSCDEREDSKKVEQRRRPSVGGVVRRTWSRVVSFLTIMTTWVLFRFLLKGLNKVSRPARCSLGVLLPTALARCSMSTFGSLTLHRSYRYVEGTYFTPQLPICVGGRMWSLYE